MSAAVTGSHSGQDSSTQPVSSSYFSCDVKAGLLQYGYTQRTILTIKEITVHYPRTGG